MEVSTRANRLRKDDAPGVDGLIDSIDVASTGNFLNENWREPFRTKLFVYAEKVDLRAFECIGADLERDRNARNKCYEAL